jgi:hypothetical protein
MKTYDSITGTEISIYDNIYHEIVFLVQHKTRERTNIILQLEQAKEFVNDLQDIINLIQNKNG